MDRICKPGDGSTSTDSRVRTGIVLLLRTAEHAFFALSIWMLIPPMPSVAYEKPPTIGLRASVAIVGLMVMSRACAYALSQETLTGVLLKAVVIWLAVWLFNEWSHIAFVDLLPQR